MDSLTLKRVGGREVLGRGRLDTCGSVVGRDVRRCLIH